MSGTIEIDPSPSAARGREGAKRPVAKRRGRIAVDQPVHAKDEVWVVRALRSPGVSV